MIQVTSNLMIGWCFITLLVSVLSLKKRDDIKIHRLTEKELSEVRRICGISQEKYRHYKVSYGVKAKQGEFPWAVQIMFKNSGLCTGSLISDYHIISAAHCFYQNHLGVPNINVDKMPDIIYALGGSPCAFADGLNQTLLVDCRNKLYKKPQRLRLRRLIIPEDAFLHFERLRKLEEDIKQNKTVGLAKWYEGSGCENKAVKTEECEKYALKKYYESFSDLAIIELKEPISASNHENIRPICIPTPDSEIPNVVLFYGFGFTEASVDENETRKNMLLHKYRKSYGILNEEQCNSLYTPDICGRVYKAVNTIDDPNTLCRGDSGGGMSSFLEHQNYLYGIISESSNYCSEPEKFQKEKYDLLVAKVSYKHDFICYYTGICPLGYNHYVDNTYPEHPEPIAYIGDGKGSSGEYVKGEDLVIGRTPTVDRRTTLPWKQKIATSPKRTKFVPVFKFQNFYPISYAYFLKGTKIQLFQNFFFSEPLREI